MDAFYASIEERDRPEQDRRPLIVDGTPQGEAGPRHRRAASRADREAKSISHETTFPADIHDREVLRAWLLELTKHVGRRARRHGLRGRTVQFKLRFSDFRTITRAHTSSQPTDSTQEIWTVAAELLESNLPNRGVSACLVSASAVSIISGVSLARCRRTVDWT